MKPHPHSPNWTRWLGHLIGKPARGLEIGTWKGESAEWMLDNVFTHPDSSYTCIDHFRGSVEHHIGGHDCSALERDARARGNFDSGLKHAQDKRASIVPRLEQVIP